MTCRNSRILAALLAAVALAFAPPAPAQSESPALWKVSGAAGGSTYLFGSFHLLPPSVKWRTPQVERALQESSAVVMELDPAVANDPQAMLQLVMKYGVLQAGETLPALLPPALNAELERTAGAFGLPSANLAPMRPWLAALTVSVQFIASKGFDPNAGVDNQIAAWARANGREIVSLETAEAQLRAFADLSRAEEIELLRVTLEQIREMPQMLDEILAAYRKGDVARLERTLNAGMDAVPALRKRLLRDRHEQWLPRIEKMIADGRSRFIVVGAAHFTGADGVIALLRAKGLKVEGP
jgi:uncharacterized protein YbaP (TraB family)